MWAHGAHADSDESRVIELPAMDFSRPPNVTRGLTNLTTGLRFGGAHISLAQSASDPNTLYLGTRNGHINVSRDGGRSWSESTALVHREKFFGSIRSGGTMGGILDRWLAPSPISIGRLSGVRLPSRLTNLTANSGDLLGTRIGGDLSPGDPLVGDLTGLESAKNSNTTAAFQQLQTQLFLPTDGGGRGGQGGGGNSLAVGLRSGAPWLAYQVRRKRNWAVGLSLKQSLVIKGSGGTTIRHLEVHPSDPGDVLAATDDGLRRSTDAGYSWPLVLTGASSSERRMNHVVRSRFDAKVIYAATGRGLKRSNNDGATFVGLENRHVVASDIRWVEEHPTDASILFVGKTGGLVRSEDGGRNFKLVHRSPWPALARVRQVRVEPKTPSRVWLATADGLLVSRDSGFQFARVGRGFFTGKDIHKIAFGPGAGHVLVSTARDLWETRDAGESWQVAYFGPIQWDIRNMVADAAHPGSFLIATTAEVLRFGELESKSIPPEKFAEYRRRMNQEPSQIDVLHRALKQAGVFRPQLMRYRANARLRGLVPNVVAAFRWAQYDTDRTFSNELYQLTPINLREGASQPFMGVVFANWDLAKVIFTSAESIGRRVARVNRKLESEVTYTVITLYSERRRLLFDAITSPGSPRAQLLRNLRLEELTAHLNALTGHVYEPYEAF